MTTPLMASVPAPPMRVLAPVIVTVPPTVPVKVLPVTSAPALPTPVPVTLIGSVPMFARTSSVAPLLTVVLPAVVPSAVAWAAASVPAMTVVVPS